MLKGSPLVGFPKVLQAHPNWFQGINGLAALRSCFSEDFEAKLGTKPRRGFYNFPDPEAKISRGRDFFSKIYAQHTNRVLENLSKGHPDLSVFTIECLYGELLSEFSVVNEQSTSLLEMVACISSNAIPQAKGHVYGARNTGVSIELIQQCVDLVVHLSHMEQVIVEFMKMDFLGKVGVIIRLDT
jgi:alkylhydroperoxidase/carboxymuconolactone decarboxylase family protein YurZ